MTARGLNVEKLARPEGPTVRDAVMSLLRDLGMTTLFGNPGSTELPLFRDMPQDFRYILGLQESVVVGMADGFAQMDGNAAFVNLHSSAGVGHALGNIFTAYRNQTRSSSPPGSRRAAFSRTIRSFMPSGRPNFRSPSSNGPASPPRAEDVPLAIARAYHMAMQAPRGPVFVSVPIDDWDRPCAPITTSQVSTSVVAPPALIAQVAQALNAAKAPVIVAGAGVGRESARAALVQLAEAHNAPVWVAPHGGARGLPGGSCPVRRLPACFPRGHRVDAAGQRLRAGAGRAGLHLSCRRLRPLSARRREPRADRRRSRDRRAHARGTGHRLQCRGRDCCAICCGRSRSTDRQAAHRTGTRRGRSPGPASARPC